MRSLLVAIAMMRTRALGSAGLLEMEDLTEVEISEQMILVNPYQGRYEIAETKSQFHAHAHHRQALAWADCATGDFGILEHWEAFAHPGFSKPFYYNGDSNRSTFQAPCIAFTSVEAAFRAKAEKYTTATHAVEVTHLNSHGDSRHVSGHDNVDAAFVDLQLLSHSHEADFDDNHDSDDLDQEDHIETVASQLVFEDDDTRDVFRLKLRPFFKFDEVLNNISGIASSFATPPLTDQFRAMYVDNYANVDLEEHRNQQVEEVIALEHLMLHFVPQRLMHNREFTNRTEQWIEIRKLVPVENRKVIAMAWEELGKMWLASGNAFLSIGSFRRALTWYPGLLPAYVEIAVVLEFFEFYPTSCAAVQSILSQVHVDEFDSSFPREILTSRFRHCDNLAWVLALWDENTFFRWFHIVSIGFSVLSSVCLMMGCCPAQIVIEETATNASKKKKTDSTSALTDHRRSDDNSRKAKAKKEGT